MLKSFCQSIGLFLGLILCFLSCKEQERQVSIKGVEIHQSTFQFHKFLETEYPVQKRQVDSLRALYPDFVNVFDKAILRSSGHLDENLNDFVHYFDSTGVHQLIQEEYGSVKFLEQDFLKVQKRLKSIFPDYKPLNLITMNSGFNFKNFLLDDAIAIGLDMYLGKEVEYKQIGSHFPEYKVHQFSKEYILPDATQAILMDIFPDQAEYSKLLDRMIYYGRILYVQSLLLPNVEPHVLLGMTKEDYAWCEENEVDIWRFFVSEQLLYNNEFHKIKTYVTDGPFSSGMPKEAPANTGKYIGWKIFKKYSNSNINKNLAEILKFKENQQILSESDYRP